MQAGRYDDAIAAYRELLAIEPGMPDVWFNRAWSERQARRFEDSLTSYAEALARGISGAEEVHLNRAVILSEHLHRTADAMKELLKAVAANPRFLQAWLNLGNLHEDLGEVEAARHAYEAALQAAPDNGRACARLATMQVFAGDPAGAAQALQSKLGLPGLAAEDRAEMTFALGTALDALGRYDEAFSNFESGNAIRRRLAPRQYDPAAVERFFDTVIETFPLPAQATGRAAAPPPLFVCGMFRSGSTLAEQILSRHSHVTAGGELDFLPALIDSSLQPFPAACRSISGERLADLRDAYLASVAALFPDADLLTDKRPDNFLYIGLIKALFPDARIVHTVRSPLDNLLSVYFLDFDDALTYGWNLADAAHWYGQYRRLMAYWRSLYGADIHDFDYDRAVADPEPEIRSLLEFCGLGWERSMLTPRESGVVRTASVWQVRQPLHQRSSGRWRNYAAHLASARAILNAEGIDV